MFQNAKLNVDTLLPLKNSGSSNDSFAHRELDAEEAAENYFNEIKKRLLTVSKWSQFAGGESFVFELTDGEGRLKNDPPLLSDRIKIQLPGPKDDAGNGYDWVEVVRMEEGRHQDTNFFLIELSPCDCPYNLDEKTAHFYSENSTNTFVVAKQGRLVQVSIHGRNEAPNLDHQTFIDKIRNFVVANTGIVAGSRIQWDIFTDNLMKEHD